jgi:hypothetical protein
LQRATTNGTWKIELQLPTKQKVQALAVREHQFLPEQYEVDNNCDQKQQVISVGGNIVTPFAFIGSHGWISSGHA